MKQVFYILNYGNDLGVGEWSHEETEKWFLGSDLENAELEFNRVVCEVIDKGYSETVSLWRLDFDDLNPNNLISYMNDSIIGILNNEWGLSSVSQATVVDGQLLGLR